MTKKKQKNQQNIESVRYNTNKGRKQVKGLHTKGEKKVNVVENNNEKNPMITKKKVVTHLLVVFLIAFAVSGILSFHSIQGLNDYLKENQVELTVDEDGIATYKTENDEGRYTQIKNSEYHVEDKYNTWYKRIQNDEVRYAENGFVYRDTQFGIARILIYDYSWSGTPTGKQVTTYDLIQNKKMKMWVVGMYLVGNIFDALFIYVLLLGVNYFYSKVLLYILPPMIVSRVTKKEEGVDKGRLEKSWRLFLIEKARPSREVNVLMVISAVLFGVGGLMNYNGGSEVFLGILSGYFVVYTLIWVIIAYEEYKRGKKLEQELLNKYKKG